MIHDSGQDVIQVQLAADVAGDPAQRLEAMNLLARLIEQLRACDEVADAAGEGGGREQVSLGQSTRHLGGKHEDPPRPPFAWDRRDDLGA